jgi:hypothetical protein
MSQLAFDPDARLARITADQQSRRRRSATERQGAHEGGPDSTNRRWVERIRASNAANTVGAEQPRNVDGARIFRFAFSSCHC